MRHNPLEVDIAADQAAGVRLKKPARKSRADPDSDEEDTVRLLLRILHIELPRRRFSAGKSCSSICTDLPLPFTQKYVPDDISKKLLIQARAQQEEMDEELHRFVKKVGTKISLRLPPLNSEFRSAIVVNCL